MDPMPGTPEEEERVRLRELVEGLGERQAIAVEFLESMLRDVRAGHVPDPRATAIVQQFGTDLDRALGWFEANGVLVADPSVGGALEALRKLDERGSRRSARLDMLARLLKIQVPVRLGGDRDALQTLVRNLVDASEWTPDQDALVDALAGLARICDLRVAGDPDILIPDLDVETRRVLPAALHRLLSAAMTGSVTFGAVEFQETPRSPDRVSEPEPASERENAPEVEEPRPAISVEPAPIPERVPEPEPASERQRAPEIEELRPIIPVKPALPPDAGAALARLLEERRYGLAGWLMHAMGQPDMEVRLLRAAALGEAIRSQAGPVTPALREVIAYVGESARDAGEPVRLVAFAGAMRAALVSPVSGATDLVLVLRSVDRGAGAADAIATAVNDARSHGVAFAGSAMARVKDIVELQGDVEGVAAGVAASLDQARSRTLKYAAATDVWKRWVDGTGWIAQLLRPVADNHEQEAASVREQLVVLREKSALARRLDDDYARIRPGRREKLHSGARRTLLEWADGLLDEAGRWTAAVDALDAARAAEGRDRWRRDAEDTLRQEVASHAPALFEVLDRLAAGADSQDALRAAAGAAKTSLEETFGLLRGETLGGDEISPREVLNGELLKVPGLPLDEELEPRREPALQELVAAAASDDWELVFRERVDEMDHDATRAVIEIVRRRDRQLADRLESLREDARREADRALRMNLAAIAADVERARRLGHVGDLDGLDLAAQAEELNGRLERDEFMAVRSGLGRVEGQLTDARDSAQRAAHERLHAAMERSGERVRPHAGRIEQRIEEGDIVTADELIAQAETTGELTELEPDPEELERWYPQLVERLAGTPLSAEAADAAGAGRRWGELDFGAVPANRQALARRALESWLRFRHVSAAARGEAWSTLQDVLAPMGLRAEREHRSGRPTDHLWWDVVGVTRTGDPLVPHFGSGSPGDGANLRLLICWSAPSAETIVQWCRGEGHDQNILVLHPGLFALKARRELAANLRRDGRRQAIAVVDDAVLLWLCLAPDPPFESLMRAVLPFTAINPYTPWSTGNVPPEMFYGRRRELEDVLAPDGTSFIFGGRQFGKSALLRRAAREMGSGGDRWAVYVDVYAREVGHRRPPEAIWEVLWAELSQRGLWSASRHTSRGVAEKFAEEVRAWLDRHANGRLLLLLDECDRFLEADAQQAEPFATVRKLKDLREETRGRFKPIFAGLHLVQRYQDVPNQPLAHLGQPISIGPLHARDAYALISRPLNALGYRFESDDLVSRITAFCGNHPNLLQFFGEALVRHMLAQSLPVGAPPCLVVERDVEAVITDRDLLDRFRERFRLTIELDPRYKVIADVIAYEAARREDSVTMWADEIRAEATYWWPEGFQAMQGEDAFRSLLDEMVGLGVLVSTTNGYRMRSPNVLRLLGSVDEIESRLVAAPGYELPKLFEASAHRRPLSDDALSPLTERQLGDLLRPRPRCVVVVGSEATGIARVTDALRQAVGETGLALHAETVRPGRHVRDPDPRDVHTIWVIDARDAGPQDAERAAEKAATVAGRRSVTAVVLTTAAQADWLIELSRTPQTRFDLVELARLDAAGLRWIDQLPAHGSPAARETLLAKTGGWPVLVDAFRRRALGGGTSLDTIMREIDAEVDEGRPLVEAVGLRGSPKLERLWQRLIELDVPGTIDELAGVLELGPGDVPALDVLRMLGALDPKPDGRFICEATLRRAWQRLIPA